MRKDINKWLVIESKVKTSYDKVVFSDEFYNQDTDMVNYQTKKYLGLLGEFYDFYSKYKPEGFRVVNDIDIYKEAKKIYDDVVDGKIYVDKVFKDPDNYLRNAVKVTFLDVPGLKKRLGYG